MIVGLNQKWSLSYHCYQITHNRPTSKRTCNSNLAQFKAFDPIYTDEQLIFNLWMSQSKLSEPRKESQSKYIDPNTIEERTMILQLRDHPTKGWVHKFLHHSGNRVEPWIHLIPRSYNQQKNCILKFTVPHHYPLVGNWKKSWKERRGCENIELLTTKFLWRKMR